MDRRDETVGRIARKLAEHQRRMLNLAVQLQALYEGRREDVAGLLKERGGCGRGGGDGEGAGSEEVGLRVEHGRRYLGGEQIAGGGGREGGVGSGQESA
jgi:hypothetical protein